MPSRQVYDSGHSVATAIRLRVLGVRWVPGSDPWFGEVGLIPPFRRNSSPYPPLFAIIHPFCGRDHRPGAAFRPPFAAPGLRPRAPPPRDPELLDSVQKPG